MMISGMYSGDFFVVFMVVLGYSVVFFSSFFLSILCFIVFSVSMLWWLILHNLSFFGLLLVIMYLGGLMVLFSYSFMLSDVKVQFGFSDGHLMFMVGVMVVCFMVVGGISEVSVSISVGEIYGSGVFMLGISGVLLYVVLMVCLYLCMGLAFL